MANRGSAFLLKLGDGASNPTYATVAGLKTKALRINGEPVEQPSNDNWRQLQNGAGNRHLSVVSEGIFTGSKAETEVRLRALAGEISNYELSFESGERLRGRFLITRLEYVGDFNGERTYALGMESSGEVVSL